MSTTVDNDRAEFEAWVSAPPIEKDIDRHSELGSWPGEYLYYEVQLAWESWCAAKIRARGELAKEAGNDFPKPRRQHVPCGECQLQPGERCDICGAVEPDEQAKEDTNG